MPLVTAPMARKKMVRSDAVPQLMAGQGPQHVADLPEGEKTETMGRGRVPGHHTWPNTGGALQGNIQE